VAEIRIEVVTQSDPATTRALADLLPQVSSRAAPLTDDRLSTVLATPATRVIVARADGAVVGMALLLICTTLTGRFGYVEEVAVDQSVRGQHVGVRLMIGLLELAAELDLDFVELTSRSSREAANGLYRSLGFVHRETNVYRHDLITLPEAR
jgi:ribosomal protein S18 acetylase RimI-like enzyme